MAMIHGAFIFLVVTFFYLEVVQSLKVVTLLRKTANCECGINNDIASRIVGGRVVRRHIYPWMVGIYRQNYFHCGGSLINDRYVLTAGHCFSETKPEDLLLTFGMHEMKMNDPMSNGFIGEVESFTIHEDFASDELHETNDIALIKLKRPVKFSSKVKPICLSKRGDFTGKVAQIIGWGKTEESGEAAGILQEADLYVISNELCKKNKVMEPHILNSTLCTYAKGADGCQGDSGGPLFLKKEVGKFFQIGVVSWGIGCSRKGFPGIFSRITYYNDWIALHTADAIFCRDLTSR